MKELKIGKTYKMLRFYNLGLPDLEKVTVRHLTTLGNGRKIVTYSVDPFPFRIYYDMDYEDFIKYTEI